MRGTEGLEGTSVFEIIEGLDRIYSLIEGAQAQWKGVTPFTCPEGCGTCCVDFEPDVVESEALYLASWLLCHRRSMAEAILNGTFIPLRHDGKKGCVLYNPDSPYHCTVYEGRPLICRLFGYSGNNGKDGKLSWKSCKFLPPGKLQGGRQYDEAELLSLFGALPPKMSDVSAQVLSLMPDRVQDRKPLHEALREAVGKLLFIHQFSNPPVETLSS